MAKFRQPNELDFTRPDQWPLWRTRFERYLIASKLSAETGEIQVNTLLYCLGADAETVFTSFNLSAEDAKDVTKVLDKFTNYFIPKRNVIHERAMFNQRIQQPGESVESFIRALHEMSIYCEFADKSNQIRDRLVVGLADRRVSRDLQLENNLTLDGAITIARQSEIVKAQLNEQIGKPAPVSAEEVRSKNARGGYRGAKSRTSRSGGSSVQNSSQGSSGASADNLITCKFCGKNHAADRMQCPARNVKCHKCQRRGHYAKFCKNSTSRGGVREVVCPEESLGAYGGAELAQDSYFLGSVSTQSAVDSPWQVSLNVCATPVTFKIDSGADVTVINDVTYKSLKQRPNLEPCTVNLTSVGSELKCIGTFSTKVERKQEQFDVRIYVVAGARSNLLGRAASQGMGFIQVHLNEVFGSIGLMDCEPVKIKLKKDFEAYIQYAPRRVPIPLLPKVKAELERMERDEVITAVTEPTEWCSPMVPVVKKDGNVRICVDLKRLNQAVLRERFMLPTLEDVLSKLAGAKVFSSLDAASGFWAIPLDSESSKLTTFITPFGRYAFRRLLFGISSAPEIFQRTMCQLLQNLEGVTVYMDDVLVYGSTQSEHDMRLKQVLARIEASGLKLQKRKCKIGMSSLDFLGHHFTGDGVSPSADKLQAIKSLDAPTNITELKRCLGMINYLGRFVKNLATILQPMNALLRRDSVWRWDVSQQQAFEKAKEVITSSPVLSFFDPNKPTVLSVDASSYGLGACLLQSHSNELRPIAFASRSLSEAERKYAQIEKECLAAVWGCEKFTSYLVGLHFKLLTDHKPLVPLIMTKDIDRVPVRCQRLLLRLMRFDLEAEHVPGKDLVVADTLSRAPLLTQVSCDDQMVTEEVTLFVDNIQLKGFSGNRLNEVRQATDGDGELQEIIQLTLKGWPEYARDVAPHLRKYYEFRGHLSVSEGMLLYDDRIFVPKSMRHDVLTKLHAGHQGVTKCRKLAQETVFWPGLSDDIKKVVESCQQCQEHQRRQRHEPLAPTPLPSRPWERVGTDLFEDSGVHFVVVTDYYSRYIEILRLVQLTSYHVIVKLKSVFARWGIPTTVVSDNGPQFSSAEFARFSLEYGFRHCTSSPHFPQSNGMAERAVQVSKSIVRQADPFLGLLAYRSTPHSATGFSPAQLVMGRNIRTTVPCLDRYLEPRWPPSDTVRAQDEHSKATYKMYYDRRHGVRNITPAYDGQSIYIRTDKEKNWSPGQMIQSAGAPRSSVVQTTSGSIVRRNNKHIRPVNHVPQSPSANRVPQSPLANRVPQSPHCPSTSSMGPMTSTSPSPISTTVNTQSADVTPRTPQTTTRASRVNKPVQRMDL